MSITYKLAIDLYILVYMSKNNNSTEFNDLVICILCNIHLKKLYVPVKRLFLSPRCTCI